MPQNRNPTVEQEDFHEPLDSGENAGQSSSGRQLKRRRVTGPQYARRKRAATACSFCRTRKTRCDNARPICGFCRINRARCVYEGEDPAEKDIIHDESSQEIIDRLEEIRSMLQSRSAHSSPNEQTHYAGVGNTLPAFSTSHASESGPDDHFSPSLSTFSALRCESLLKWPVFNGLVTDGERQVTSFALEPMSNLEKDRPSPLETDARARNAQRLGSEMSKGGRGVKDDDFVPLCRKFLIHVHPRNPILEADELINYAREASEHGLSWDSASCLVLLACALACYTIPWETATRLSVTVSDVIIPADVSEEDKATAEAYYLAARKRIGLLGTSIQDIQCLFFASVFEKYSMRPVQAWFYIQQAATRLQAHLIGCGRQPAAVDSYPTDKSVYHLEQRIFWSCVKAESELAPELGLQASGLTGYAYPDQFPSPPKALAQARTEADVPMNESSQSQERGWFFYLAEISLRRTINDTLQLLYRHGERKWIESIDLLVAQHDEQQKQVMLWHSYLPSTIQFPDTELAKHELSFYLQGRFLEWRQYLHRPFLFYALHQPLNHVTGPRIVQLAQEGIEICAETLPQCIHHHRHGGTWFVARSIWICAMLILAVVLRQGEVYPPPDWRSLVQMALQALQRWTHEAPDIHRMELILARIFERVQSNPLIQVQDE